MANSIEVMCGASVLFIIRSTHLKLYGWWLNRYLPYEKGK